jgi:hypothetical protein
MASHIASSRDPCKDGQNAPRSVCAKVTLARHRSGTLSVRGADAHACFSRHMDRMDGMDIMDEGQGLRLPPIQQKGRIIPPPQRGRTRQTWVPFPSSAPTGRSMPAQGKAMGRTPRPVPWATASQAMLTGTASLKSTPQPGRFRGAPVPRSLRHAAERIRPRIGTIRG